MGGEDGLTAMEVRPTSALVDLLATGDGAALGEAISAHLSSAVHDLIRWMQ